MPADGWDPRQYELFQREREQGFFDLLAMVQPAPGMRVADLGCGTGRLTGILHQRLGASLTLGIDRSRKMLEDQNAGPAPPGLRFEVGAIEDFPGTREPFDLIFSNAALHWVEDHAGLLPRLAAGLTAGGQLAFQVPAMDGDAAHETAEELAATEPFKSALSGWRRPRPVLPPEQYARILYRCGFSDPQTRLIVYPHVLPGPEAVVEWTRGALLTAYARRLPAPLFESFVERYRGLLLERLEPTRPYFFPFRRILCWGHRA